MALIEETLFGTVDKVADAIKLLKLMEPREGYYLAFSGGKDSMCIYHLAVEAGVKFDAHYHLTTADPPELVRFIKTNYPNVIIDRPKITMWRLIVKSQIPPTRIARYCCHELKEGGGAGRLVLTGIRWEESSRRKKRKQFEESCMGGIVDKTKVFLHPIISWTTKEVWEFIKNRNLPYCELYDKGFKRLGCIGCPIGGPKNMIREFALWPKYKDAYLRAFAKMLAARKAKGKVDPGNWTSPEAVMKWWINEQVKGKKEDDDQLVLFE